MTSANNPNKAVVEYGDYQTPVSFALKVCEKLVSFYGMTPDVVLEPTFGVGNFFGGIASEFTNARALYGIEINPGHYNAALREIERNSSLRSKTTLFNADIFSFDFNRIKGDFSKNDSLLILGNPPWATNSQLTSIGSDNLPLKRNFKGYSGLDAITGKGNFDIAEFIVLRLLHEFAQYNCTLAMLCKTIVAKNIIRDIDRNAFSISAMDLFAFNANEIFGVNCDAGLLAIRLGKAAQKTCTVYDFCTNEKLRRFGWVKNAFYSDISRLDAHSPLDGACQLEWRQGIKHDCSRIMELAINESGLFENGMGDTLDFQPGRFVYPLVKSSDIKKCEITETRKYVIVPQKRVNEDTSGIRDQDPAVWAYLQKYEAYLSARKSIIYKRAPKYAIFGIGEYSFAKYKVGISGFYKEPGFALIAGDMPIMMDDTCYFLSFDVYENAAMTLALLSSPECAAFLKSIAFLDSKRPYTKEILRRIDLEKLRRAVRFEYVREFVRALSAGHSPTKADYENYHAFLFRTAPKGLFRLPQPGVGDKALAAVRAGEG